MGDVYRAEDTRLHRVVAIKTLSERLEANPQAIERFEREARAAASLNHPNICTIYDVGTHPPFIAMELLEGETLQQRLTRGPLDVMTAVDVTLGLVDALDAAHEKGILHRDIKPANVFLTDRGPKILDFGLAKAVPSSAKGGVADKDTRPPEVLLTAEGTAVGTAAYMSPEQLRGRLLDPRSDLFSLGLVMYEMVTGRPAFTGETSAVIAAAILQEQPVLPRHVREDAPARLEDIILKTIEKDPRDRTQSAAELRADLRRLKRDLESGTMAARKPGNQAPVARGSGSNAAPARISNAQPATSARRGIASVAAAVAVVLLAGVGYVLWSRQSAPVGADLRTLIQTAQVSQVTVTGNAWRPALSPDGKYVVYIRRAGADRSLRMRQLGTDRDVEIVAAEPGLNLHSATVTPDGSFIDFVRGSTTDTTLWRVPFLGGSPRRFLDDVDSPLGWSPDGRHLAFVRADFEGSSTLVVANADGTSARLVATRKLPRQFLSFGSRGTPSAQGASIHPAWSPDGRTIALLGFEPIEGVVTRQAIFVDVEMGSERTIPLRDESTGDGIEWLDSSHLVVSLEGANDAVSQIWLLSYPDAQWSRLTNDLTNYASFGISADRRSIVTTRWDYRVAISVLESGSNEPYDMVAAGPFVGSDMAWAGDRLLYGLLSPVNNHPAIWALRRGESNPQELIPNAYSPNATPDGKTIVFSRFENGRRGIWRADGEGRGAIEVGSSASDRITVTPDGKQAFYLSLESGVQSAWSVPLDGGRPRPLTTSYAFQPVPSPDGQSLAFVALAEQGKSVVAVCALPDCTSRRQLPLPRRPDALQWMPDGRGLAYATRSNIWAQPLNGGAPSQLTRFPEDEQRIEDFEWSADGRRLAFTRSRTTWDIVLFRTAAD